MRHLPPTGLRVSGRWCNARDALEMEELKEVLPAATLSKHQPCRAKPEQDAVSSLTDPSRFSPDLVVSRGDDHYPTL